MLRIEAQVEAQDDRVQQQRSKAVLVWIIIVVVAPFLSPIFLVLLLLYQFCCVRTPTNVLATSQAKVVLCTVAVILSVAWVPACNLILFILSYGVYNTQDVIDTFAPLIIHVVLVLWGSIIAFRLFALADTYEPETERPQIHRLAEVTLSPPIEVRVRRQNPRGPHSDKTIHTALELFQHFKGEWHLSWYVIGGVGAVTAGTTLGLSLLPQKQEDSTHSPHHVAMRILSTTYLAGVTFSVLLAFVHIIALYISQVSFIRRLTYAIDVDGAQSQINDVAHIDVFSIGQLWVWEECRRLAVEELTSSKSILNAVLTPTMWMCALSTTCVFCNLVVYVLFLGLKFGRLEVGQLFLMVFTISFIGVAVVVAKVAQGHFKRQAALIAHRTFDVARIIDVYYTNAEQGIGTIEDYETRAALFGETPKHSRRRRRHRKLTSTSSTDSGHRSSDRSEASLRRHRRRRADSTAYGPNYMNERDWETEHDKQLLTLPKLERVYASLHSICTFMVTDHPSPLLLGVELRHVRFVLIFALLISSNILFISLMIAFKTGKCSDTSKK